MARFALWLLAGLLAACGVQVESGVRLRAVSPTQGGDDEPVVLEVEGENFRPRVFTDFRSGDRSAVTGEFELTLVPTDPALPEVVLEEVTVRSAQRLEVKVPAGVARGFYSLRLVDPYGVEELLPEVYRVVRSPRFVAGFSFQPLGPQRVAIPFSVQLSAVDDEGAVVDGFSGEVALSDDTGTVTPGALGPFTLGRLRAQVTVSTVASGNRLGVVSPDGQRGESIPFEVLPGLATHLAIRSPAQSLQAGECSSPVEVEPRDTFELPAVLESDLQLQLSAAPPDGVSFFADAACTVPLDELTLDAPGGPLPFHFRSERAQPFQLRVVPDLLPTASQPQAVAAAPASAAAFEEPLPPLRLGTCSAALGARAVDAFGNPSAPAAPETLALEANPPGALAFFADAACATPLAGVSFSPSLPRADLFVRPAGVGTVTLLLQPAGGGQLSGTSAVLTVAP